jgi:hypothetical protein
VSGACERIKHKMFFSVIVVPGVRVLFHSSPIDFKVGKKICDEVYKSE